MKKETVQYCICAVTIAAFFGGFWGCLLGWFYPMAGLIVGLLFFALLARILINMILLEEEIDEQLEKAGFFNDL